jgi:hypothetical protein
MLLTFGELVTQTAIDLKYGPTPGTEITVRLRRHINEAHRRVLRASNVADQREITVPLTTAADQTTYGVAQAFDRIQRIWEPGGARRLVCRTADWLTDCDPQNDAIGTPEAWVPLGLQAVSRQPPLLGSTLWVSSNHPNDITIQARITAVRRSGQLTRPMAVTLAGVSPVPIGAPGVFVAVTAFTLNTPAVGDVTLWDAAAGGHALAMIDHDAGTSNPYYAVRLWPTPEGPLDYAVTGTVRIPDLIFDTDVPRVSPEYVDALATYARMREYRTVKDDTDRFLIEQRDWSDTLAELRAFAQFPPDYRPVAGGPADRHRTNNLGGQYPAD